MKSALRKSIAVLAGLFTTFVFLVAVEVFSTIVHPLPEGFGGTKEEMCRHVENYPHWVLAVVVPAWAFAAFASTWTAQKIGKLHSAAMVGLLLLAALVANVSMLPYPTWFKFASLLATPIATIAGMRRLPHFATADADPTD